jgi:membrane associated rhomboid family serine protease
MNTDQRSEGPGRRMPRSEPIFDLPMSLIVLIGLFVAVQGVREVIDPQSDLRLLATFAFVPDRLIFEAGEPAYPGGYGAVVWTFLTYGFLHDGWVHLGINSAMLAALGRGMVHRIGSARTMALLGCATVAGAVVHLIVGWGGGGPMIGASGAVSGLLGALPRFAYRPAFLPAPTIVETLRDGRARGFVLALVVANGVLVVFGTGPFGGSGADVAWGAHLGGFLFGFLAFGLFDRVPRRFFDEPV